MINEVKYLVNNFSLSSRRRRVVKGRSVFRNTGRLLWPVISLALSHKHTTQLPPHSCGCGTINEQLIHAPPLARGTAHAPSAWTYTTMLQVGSLRTPIAHPFVNGTTANDCACAHQATYNFVRTFCRSYEAEIRNWKTRHFHRYSEPKTQLEMRNYCTRI